MNVHETRRYLMFGRVEAFGKATAADFDPHSEGASRFATITQIICDIDAAKAGQRRGRATAKNVLFALLRAKLRNIARSARAIARDKPGFADKFRVPESSGHRVLLTAADAMLIQLRKPGVAAKFIAHELPADFVEQLTADRKAIAGAQGAHGVDNFKGVTNTAAVGRLIRAGMKEVAYLDAIIGNKYIGNPEQLWAWRSARTLERAPRREPAASDATTGEMPVGDAGEERSEPPAVDTTQTEKSSADS